MAIIKLSIRTIYTRALLTKGYHIHDSLQKNAAFFQNPAVQLPVFRQSLDALFDAYMASKTKLDMIVVRRQREAAVREQIRLLCNYVANVSAGNAVRIRQGGFECIERMGRIGLPEAVRNFRVTFAMGFSGQLKIQFRRSRGATAYIIKMQEEEGGEFKIAAVTPHVRISIKNLVPGRFYAFTCTPLGTAGFGAESQAERCIAV